MNACRAHVTMGWTYTIDEDWTYADRQGHEHHYDHGYPTLDFIIDEQHWCDGTEGMGGHDPHWTIDELHYECKECREVIKPALIPPGTTKYIAGPMTAEVEGVRSDGRWIRAVLSPDEGQALYEAIKRGDDLQPLVDGIDEERIVESRFST